MIALTLLNFRNVSATETERALTNGAIRMETIARTIGSAKAEVSMVMVLLRVQIAGRMVPVSANSWLRCSSIVPS